MKTLSALACSLLLLVTAAALAQPGAISAEALAGHMPATLGGGARDDLDVYSAFVTASYRLSDGTSVSVQFHDVRGAGSEAHLRGSCPRFARIAGYEACVMPSYDGGVSLTWVLADTIQVMLGGLRDEAAAARVAADLPLPALARMAGVR